MSYQNVTTPRFYIDQFSYLLASKQVDVTYYDGHTNATPASTKNVFNYPGLVGLTPTEKYETSMPDTATYRCYDIPTNFNTATPIGGKTAYACVLGHNCRSTSSNGIRVLSEWHDGDGDKQLTTETEIVNLTGDGTNYPHFDGFTMWEISGEPTTANQSRFMRICFQQPDVGDNDFNEAYTIGIHSISWGFAYDMPRTPNLSLSLSHNYSGISKSTSVSGSSHSNANWIKPPKWGDLEAWQLAYPYSSYPYIREHPRAYSGKRIWTLSFSYLSESDLEPRNYTGLTTTSFPGDDNWFESVLHYTMGGALPFIFQPNKDATFEAIDSNESGTFDYLKQIPEFAICRFDMHSFKRELVAPQTYSISITIKECW